MDIEMGIATSCWSVSGNSGTPQPASLTALPIARGQTPGRHIVVQWFGLLAAVLHRKQSSFYLRYLIQTWNRCMFSAWEFDVHNWNEKESILHTWGHDTVISLQVFTTFKMVDPIFLNILHCTNALSTVQSRCIKTVYLRLDLAPQIAHLLLQFPDVFPQRVSEVRGPRFVPGTYLWGVCGIMGAWY